jgi:hypothetical protein
MEGDARSEGGARFSRRFSRLAALAAFGCLGLASIAAARGPDPAPLPVERPRAPDARPVDPDEQIGMVTLLPGKGPSAKVGDVVTIRFKTGAVEGRRAFVLGRGQVVRGWDEGVVGMQVGEKRRLTLGPAMAQGFAPAGPDAGEASGASPTRGPGDPGGPTDGAGTLVFQVELLAIE